MELKKLTNAMQDFSRAIDEFNETMGDYGMATQVEVTKPEPNVTNIYEAPEIKPLVYLTDGSYQLAALMWLSFVAVLFLVMLQIIPADALSAGAMVLFFLIATMVSFYRSRDG